VLKKKLEEHVSSKGPLFAEGKGGGMGPEKWKGVSGGTKDMTEKEGSHAWNQGNGAIPPYVECLSVYILKKTAGPWKRKKGRK